MMKGGGKSAKGGKGKKGGGGGGSQPRSTSVDSKGKPRSTTDPALACKKWLKGRCADGGRCKLVHNPQCYWHRKSGSCSLGDKCLFLHTGGRAAAAEAGADAGGDGTPKTPKAPAQPKVKAKAKAKATKKSAAMIQSAEDDE